MKILSVSFVFVVGLTLRDIENSKKKRKRYDEFLASSSAPSFFHFSLSLF